MPWWAIGRSRAPAILSALTSIGTTNADGTPNLSAPQGQLASSTAAIVGAKNDDILEVVNGVDPDTSAGRFQDAIGRIYFIERHPALPTTVMATCLGLPGTSIPVGARAQATDAALRGRSRYAPHQPGGVPVDKPTERHQRNDRDQGVDHSPLECVLDMPISDLRIVQLSDDNVDKY